jgi:flagellar export protein FliJ
MAKRFIFRLETVERLRKQARDEQRRSVAEAVRALASAESRAALLNAQLRDMVELTRGARLTERLDIAALRGNQLHRNWLYRRIMGSSEEIAAAQARLDAERAKLGEATARLKVLEKLRERRWSRHLVEVAREEQTIASEIAVQGFVRRMRAGHEVSAA